MQTALTIEEIKAAQNRLSERRGHAAGKIAEIEAGHDKRIMAFAMGQITGAELDDVAVELNYWRGVLKEDRSSARAHFEGLVAEIHKQERADRNKEEILAQKRGWAEKWNSLIARTTGFSLSEVAELANGRPADLPGGGPAWHRFESLRPSFGALIAGSMTYAEYANLESYHPE
jgi:hypothetical protein